MEKLDDIINNNNISNEDMEFIREKLNNVDLSICNKLLSLVKYIYNVDDISTPRFKNNTTAKKVFIYLLYDMLGQSYNDIARRYNIDSRVVYTSKQWVKNNIEKDYMLKQKIDLIKKIMIYDNTKF